MSEEDSDSGLQNRRKNPPRNINSASTSSLSPVITRRRRYVEDGSDSDSGSSIDTNPRKKRVPLPRDEDSDSSDSVIVKRVRRTVPVVSDSGSDPGFEGSSSSSGSDSEQAPFAGNGAESDASDGQSEKCPICLVSLKTQELGTPESCDHVFCVECILEWSKKMNTCPVDRQQFRLILVRKKINGKIYRQIPIEPPQQSELEIVEDPTFCEICGSGDHEDRMLLCDGCDLGFHLECLNPPLNDVPGGAWFCNDCSPDDVIDPEIELFELQMLIDDAHDLERPQTRRRRAASPRLVPRTQLSERVRRRVVGSRSQNTNPDGVSSTSRRKKKRRKRTRIVYKIDEATGETVAVKKRRKRKKRKRRAARVPKTIKSRLAVQLGMCPPSDVPLAIPEVRIPNVPNSQVSNIQMQRHQAGIPALNIFGLRDDLDYFSPQSEDEDDGTVMRRRAPNRADVATMRRARAKTIHLPSSVSSSSDILGCILNNQEQLYSKKSKMSLGENGKVIIEKVKDYQKCIRQTPADNTTNDSVPTSSSGATNYEASGSPERAAMPTSTVTSNTSTSNSGSEENRETSSTYEQQSLCSSDSKKEKKPDSRSQTPCSESEIDIYSDIETVSTSKVDDDFKATSPVQAPPSDDDNNDSEPDMVIDTEKNPEPDEVTSTVDSNVEAAPAQHLVTSSSEIQSGAIQSSSQHFDEGINKDDDEDSEDGCPNFSIYSKESKKMAKNTDITLDENDQVGEVTSAKTNSGLYSDSEDETVVKKIENSFGMADLMTEDISEEERSYTPCLDERPHFKQGLEGLDTEMISDEDRNDFDETQEVKLSDDALEINAKENDLDFSRPEDYEEGEIVDKNKAKKTEEKKEEAKEEEKNENKENENANKEATFKKLSKSTKERNYRDKDKSKSPEKRDKNEKENSKREKKKRKEIQRYNVRAIIEKPRRLLKDEFGRDIRRSPSDSRSRSPTPKRSVSRSRRRSRSKRRSPSRERRNKRRRSRRRSLPRSRSRSVRRSLSKSKKRKRTRSLSRRRKSRDRSKGKKKRSLSRQRSRSLTPKRKEFQRRRTWTSLSRSRSPEMRHLTPSWTPPRALDNAVKPHNLTVILPNDTKKKKEKKRKAEKKKEAQPKKRKRNERTPPPSKEVFASGDNILVSVSFNKENETRDVSTKRKKDIEESKKRKEKKNRTKKKGKDLTGVKPVAIIDLERSPFKELTPSPKDVIVLSDSENEESRNTQKNNCDSSQQVESPNYSTGPKTPPEPQVKFTLISKQPQLRAISNPLHEPDEVEPEVDQPEVVDPIHKGPNTPPEPPNSPPSSPDVYDPFEPTKSRSPTPDPPVQAINTLNLDEKMDNTESEQKSNSMTQTPDALKSHTPPLADIQPADSQSSIQVTPESSLGKSPERSSTSTISQSVQTQTISTKTIATTSFPTIPLITSTPINSVVQPSRINILNSTIITPPSSMPQRVVLPSPVKLKQARKSKSSSEPTEGAISLDSPYSPGSSDYEDLFEPPVENKPPSKPTPPKNSKSPSKVQNTFDALFGTTFNKVKTAKPEKTKFNKKSSLFPIPNKGTKQVGVKLDEDNLKILDDLPNSAVEMQVKDKFLKKLNRQERVVEEVKLVLKPHYNKKHLNKDEYKDILRRAVPKICHNKTGEINPTKIKNLIEAYVKKVRHSKKVTSSTQKASG